MTKKHQNYLNDRQIEILSSLATKGRQTKSQLSTEFGIKYPAIVGSMKILEDRKMVKIAHQKKGVGKPKLFYELTDTGLEVLSKESRINLEKFWEIAFLVYSRMTKDKTKFPLETFFSNYEKNVLGYSLEYSTFSWNFIIDAYNLLYKRPIKHSVFTTILYALATNGKISDKKLVSVILNSKDPYQSISTTENEIVSVLHNMISNKLIITITGSEVKHRLSSLGMLVLFHYLIDRTHENTSGYYSGLGETLQKIAHKSLDVIPMIFSYWDQLLKIESGINLLLRFNAIGNDHMPISNSISQGGVAEILIMEKMLVKSNLSNIRLEYTVGISTLIRLMKEGRHPDNVFSDATMRCAYLGILNQYTKEEAWVLKKVTKKNYSLEELADKSLANIIAFEFYLHMLELIQTFLPSEFRKKTDNERENLDQWIKVRLSKWNSFVKNNTQLRKWYENWITQIIEFERKNIEVLSKNLETEHSLTV